MVRKSRVKNKTKRQKGGRNCPDEYPECVEYKSMIPKLSGNYCYNKNSKEYWSKLPDNCELGINYEDYRLLGEEYYRKEVMERKKLSPTEEDIVKLKDNEVMFDNLSFDVDDKDLMDVANSVIGSRGTRVNRGKTYRGYPGVEIKKDKSGKSRGWGIVSFGNSSQAMKAESMFQGADFDGKLVIVHRGKSEGVGAFRKNKRNRIKASKKKAKGSKNKERV